MPSSLIGKILWEVVFKFWDWIPSTLLRLVAQFCQKWTYAYMGYYIGIWERLNAIIYIKIWCQVVDIILTRLYQLS